MKMSNPVVGYVFDQNGMYERKFYFEGTYRNIAHFLMQNSDNACCITDMWDLMICTTMAGGFLDRVSDPVSFRNELLKELIPLQMGESAVEPLEFALCDGDYLQKGFWLGGD